MHFRFSRHAKEKLLLVKKYGFTITQKMVKQAVIHPIRVDTRQDGTLVANTVLSEKLVLRVAHRYEGDIIVIITIYPGRRKAYGL